MSKSAIKPALFLMCITIIFFSCRTVPFETEDRIYIQQVGDVTITLTYLTENDLVKANGRENNPYILKSKGVAQRDLMVFKFKGESDTTKLYFNVTDVSLTMAGVTDNAKNAMRFLTYWKGYVDESEVNAMDSRIRHTILPDLCKILPEKPLEGYLVFNKNFPNMGGEASIQIPAYTDDGDTGIIEIPFYFYDPKYVPKDKKNGIFNKQKRIDKNDEKKGMPDESVFDKQLGDVGKEE